MSMSSGILYNEEKKKYKEVRERKSKRELHQEKDISFSFRKILIGISSFIKNFFGFGFIDRGGHSSTYKKEGIYNAKKYRKIRKKKKHLAKSMQKRMWT